MSAQDPRGTITRTYQTADGRTVGMIRWTRGHGPAQAFGDFREGQAVTLVGRKVVGK